MKVFRAETNWEAGEALLLEIDSNVAPCLGLGGDEILAKEVAFVSREEGGLLHYPGSGKPGPQIVDTVVARKDGTEDGPPRLYLGRGLHSAPSHTGNLPRLARGPGRPGRLLRRPGATTSDCRNKCHTTGSAGANPTMKRSR